MPRSARCFKAASIVVSSLCASEQLMKLRLKSVQIEPNESSVGGMLKIERSRFPVERNYFRIRSRTVPAVRCGGMCFKGALALCGKTFAKVVLQLGGPCRTRHSTRCSSSTDGTELWTFHAGGRIFCFVTSDCAWWGNLCWCR